MSAQRSSRRFPLGLLFKAGVSTLLIGYLFARVGWDAVRRELAHADPWMLGLYVLLGLAATGVSAAKWLILARAQGLSATLPRLFLLYMVGYFFNNFLPSSVGGDFVRAYELGKKQDRQSEAAASVFMERFTGFTTLMVFVGAALFLDPRFLADTRLLAALGVAGAGYVVLTWAAFNRSILERIQKHLRLPIAAKLLRKAGSVQEALHRYRHHRSVLLIAIAYSVVFYALTVAIVYVGCLTFGERVPITALVAAVPLMLLLFTLPISIGGIGLQEWAYVFVLSAIGVPSAVGLGLGLLFRARTLAFGLIGGGLYPLMSRNRGPRAFSDRPNVMPSLPQPDPGASHP